MTHRENTDESSSDSDEYLVAENILLAKVLTVSDGVMSGSRQDKSGEALVLSLSAHGFNVVEHRAVADPA